MTVPRRPASRRPAGARASSQCSEADQLWAYLDGELPAARSRAIARHVVACAACEARARRLRTMLETCRAAGCQKLPADVRARARARVRALLATAHTKP